MPELFDRCAQKKLYRGFSTPEQVNTEPKRRLRTLFDDAYAALGASRLIGGFPANSSRYARREPIPWMTRWPYHSSIRLRQLHGELITGALLSLRNNLENEQKISKYIVTLIDICDRFHPASIQGALAT